MCNIFFALKIDNVTDSRRCKITTILQAGKAKSSILLIDFQYFTKILHKRKSSAI